MKVRKLKRKILGVIEGYPTVPHLTLFGGHKQLFAQIFRHGDGFPILRRECRPIFVRRVVPALARVVNETGEAPVGRGVVLRNPPLEGVKKFLPCGQQLGGAGLLDLLSGQLENFMGGV